MQKTRQQQQKAQSKTARAAGRTQGATRTAPQPIDDKLLKQISGGTDAPRGNW